MTSSRSNAQHRQQENDRLKEFYVPDLCRVRAVFMLLVTSEVLTLALALVRSGNEWIDWSYFGLVSLFVQWTVLSSTALVCLLRKRLSQLPVSGATLAILGVVLADVLMFSLLADYLLSAGSGVTSWQDVTTNLILAALFTLMILRYFYLQYQSRQQRDSELQARISALQARIHPHFLFNSMNTIASLIAVRPEQAEDAVLDLSELFRASLGNSDRVIPLAAETDLCRRYLDIEQLRLGDRLTVKWQLEDGLDKQAIPPLTLQPLLENAVYHGIQPRPEGGTITIEGYRKGQFVYLLVHNPLPEPERPAHHGNHMAIANTQARLRGLFGDSAVLKHSHHEGIYTVTVRLPRQTASHHPKGTEGI
ncbi:MAG TPA: sensor histidine kinase [Marinobacter sp.]|nr:sensor histidine kinase [Marinobacter sp.]